jgi:hypothetical protein
MAQPSSPFKAGGVAKRIDIDVGQTLVIRVDDAATAKVVVQKNGEATATTAGYVLYTKDAVEIKARNKMFVTVLDLAGTPDIFWELE